MHRRDGSFGTCTGTLIGKDLVLTNSHCIYQDLESQSPVPKGADTNAEAYLVFKPNYMKQEAGDATFFDQALVIDYQFGWEPGWIWNQDWALLKLDQNLGDTYGYLGWRDLDFSNPQVLAALQSQVRLAGYSADFPRDFPQRQSNSSPEGAYRGDVAGVHLGCSIEGVTTADINFVNPDSNTSTPEPATSSMVFHSCDTTKGSSGGAMFAFFAGRGGGEYAIVGLNNAELLNRRMAEPLSNSAASCQWLNPNTREIETETGGCINLGVQVSKWSSQAVAMREP